MKGIVLAGGHGTRLHPLTLGVSKQLLPIYDKPMIYYPLSVLMLAGINEILIISSPNDIDGYKRLLNDGSSFGLKIDYKIQPNPDGLAHAFVVGENFVGDEDVCLILGDNIFYGQAFTNMLLCSIEKASKGIASVFGYPVNNPEDFGVIEFDQNKRAISIHEKPSKPKSNYAVTGLYFYPNDVIKKTKDIKPSVRGELEITSINNMYLEENLLHVEELGRGFAWLDTGTHESLMAAGLFIQTIERRQGFKVACLEEIAFKNNWISQQELNAYAETVKNEDYRNYLFKVAKGY